MARGKKDCPKCNTEMGARYHKCSNCGHDLKSSQVSVENGTPTKDHIDATQAILRREARRLEDRESVEYSDVCKNPDEHADRILGYGFERAQMLFDMHRWGNGWSHVNWNRVEEGLSKFNVN